jgi:hypothetical protein
MIKEFTDITHELFRLRESEAKMRVEMERLAKQYREDLAYNTKLI